MWLFSAFLKKVLLNFRALHGLECFLKNLNQGIRHEILNRVQRLIKK